MSNSTEMLETQIAPVTPVLIADACTGCGLCVRVCPEEVLGMHARRVVFLHPEDCDYTGLCARVCPTTAIQLWYHVIQSEKY